MRDRCHHSSPRSSAGAAASHQGDGWRVLAPGHGHMACGDAGPGRLSEPEEIVAELERLGLA